MQPKHFILLVLPSLALAAPAFTPTCTAKATYETQQYLPGRVVTITPVSCPSWGVAYVRFRSDTGIQPDAPPGYFKLAPGKRITRRVPADWWVEARDKTLKWNVVQLRPAGGDEWKN